MGLASSTVTRAPDEYIFVSDDPVPSMWYPLPGLSVLFSLNACAVDQFYYALVWTREIFLVKQIAHVAIAKCT